MKQLYTYKAMRNQGYPIIAIGYCEAQTLFSTDYPFGYSKGVYGWNCYYYMVHGDTTAIISTGYRTIGITADHEIVKEFEKKAREARETLSYEECQERLYSLQKDFVKAILG